MPNTPLLLQAGEDIYPSRFIELSTSVESTALLAGANARPIGISDIGTKIAPMSDIITTRQPLASSGEAVGAFGHGDVCLLEAGDVITMGARLKPDSTGRGVPIATSGTTIQNIGAYAEQAATAAGELIRVQIVLYSERPDPS